MRAQTHKLSSQLKRGGVSGAIKVWKWPVVKMTLFPFFRQSFETGEGVVSSFRRDAHAIAVPLLWARPSMQRKFCRQTFKRVIGHLNFTLLGHLNFRWHDTGRICVFLGTVL